MVIGGQQGRFGTPAKQGLRFLRLTAVFYCLAHVLPALPIWLAAVLRAAQ